MSIIFTHFKKNKRKKISQFLESEIEHIDNLISVVSDSESTLNKVLIDYSKSLFFVSNEDDNDTVILN